MRKVNGWVTFGLAMLALTTAGAEELRRVATDMDVAAGLNLTGAARIVREGPGGRAVLRADGRFSGRIDLKAKGIAPRDFDLLKVQVKADRGAFLRFSLENYPGPGDLSHWYVLDTSRGAFDWRTIWIDLRRPEEIKLAGAYKGMAKADPTLRGLRFDGFVKDLKRATQGPGRRLWLGPVRFVRSAVDVDWDQSKAPYTWGAGEVLAFTYPIVVTNRLDRPLTAVLKLVPFQADEAAATLSADTLALKPGETRTVQARIALPAAVASAKPPLYCERFELRASAEGIEDSEVTILRSSDPIHLTVTVPIAEDRLAFPLLPRRRDLPESVTGLPRERWAAAEALAQAVKPGDLDAALDGPLDPTWRKVRGFSFGRGRSAWAEAGHRYLDGLTACAFLYDLTGKKQCLDKGTALLVRAAEIFPGREHEWAGARVGPISCGILSGNTLALGWSTGSMRAPYACQRHGMFNDFDLLAHDMPPEKRRFIIGNLLVPAAIRMRNQYIGLGNQQSVTNYPVLYAGLAARNWPLVSFAYSAEHGVLGHINWCFGDDGLCLEGHYQLATVRPVLYATELLAQVGVDLYDQRLYTIVHSKAAEAIGKKYNDSIVAWLDQKRLDDVKRKKRKATDGLHLATGVTVLKWNGLEVAMNWGTQLHRDSADRCALRFSVQGRHPLAALRQVGGGNYTHSSLGQSIIIVDEGRQNTTPARVVGYDIEGPVQFVQATSDRQYPGTRITRTFALLGDLVLVVDRVAGDAPHTVDWSLRYAGGNQWDRLAQRLSVPVKQRPGSFTTKAGDRSHGVVFGANLKSEGHAVAATDATWRDATSQMTMLGAPGTQVLMFAVHASYAASRKEKDSGVPVLMVRRRNVKQTDFVACFSPATKTLARVPVVRADGRAADAVGVRITLQDGRTLHAIVNYEPAGTAVVLGALKTTERFASDFK